MPNVRGPKEDRRMLYSAVAHSILLYAAPVWSEELQTKKTTKELAILQGIQKQIALRIILGYRTVSYIAALMLARILPIEFQSEILRRLYLRKKEFLNLGHIDNAELAKYQKTLTEDAINRWKVKLNKPSLPGKRIRIAFLPQLSLWFNTTHKGGLTYRLTQVLTRLLCQIPTHDREIYDTQLHVLQ